MLSATSASTATAKRPASRLAGYVVPEPGAALDPAEITAFVGTILASYMVPSAVMVLETLPLGPAGKIDRKALPAPDFGTRAATGRAPQTDTERVLADLFAEKWAEARGEQNRINWARWVQAEKDDDSWIEDGYEWVAGEDDYGEPPPNPPAPSPPDYSATSAPGQPVVIHPEFE